jgi:uncharacterized protein (DUF2267 family)
MEEDVMIAAGLDVFDRTLHKTHEWLADLMRLLAVDDRRVAYQALRATLHALRDRLTVEEVAQLGAQLPMLVRGFYYEGWDPTAKPLKLRRIEAFLAYIASEFSNDDVDPEQAARAVFALLAERVTAGEVEDVKHILPAQLRELWP